MPDFSSQAAQIVEDILHQISNKTPGAVVLMKELTETVTTAFAAAHQQGRAAERERLESCLQGKHQFVGKNTGGTHCAMCSMNLTAAFRQEPRG